MQAVLLDGIREDLSDPAVVDEFEQRFNAAMRKPRVPSGADAGKRITQLEREVKNIGDAIAGGLLSDALTQRLRAAEEELVRVRSQTVKRPKPTVLVPDARQVP